MPGPWSYRLEIKDQASQQTKYFRPPAPAFYATISYKGNVKTIPALVDTGADMTAIPHDVVEFLSLRKYSERRISHAGGPGGFRPIFKANISFLDFSFADLLMISLEDRIHALIGRDILNNYKAVFDGPNLQFLIE